MTRILTVSVLSLVLLAACSGSPTTTNTEATAPTTAPTETTTSTSDVSTASPVAPEYTNANFGLFDLPNDPRSFDALDDLGAGWVRVQFRLGERDPAALLAVTERLFAEGIGVWLTVHYRDPANIADQAGLAASERGSFPPVDPDVYSEELGEVLELLLDQMADTGRDPTTSLIVQFSNEVVPSDYAPGQPSRYFHGTGDEYLATCP